ncbi:outer membrane beta-barrel protein [Pontibacter sp. G13]|uniref:outer membrane beta-barrel protein n=1 Tax=Pontibacter sp. G13 TaxID=3074898 RepID=UPI00288B572D|nr:outer membrane beta-barrel protein [Pontibacter sp. G13]WNJ19440.1 outer membrane beta-barrel protein [Pontibacter sp. G13]
MNRILTCCSLLLLLGMSQMSFAQRSLYKPQVHEIGLQFASIDQIPSFTSEYDGMPFSANFINGIRYKYHLTNRGGIRLGVQYLRSQFDQSSDTSASFFRPASRNRVQVDLGYEWKLPKGPHQYFWGLEGTYVQGHVNDLSDRLDVPPGSSVKTALPFRGFGGSAFVGYRYFFNTHFSLAAEAHISYTRNSYEDDPSILPAAPNYVFQEDIVAFQGLVYLSYHFVKMKKRCACPRFK